jgi:hypothetical protein
MVEDMGKSIAMGSLLITKDTPFVRFAGLSRPLPFVQAIEDSGQRSGNLFEVALEGGVFLLLEEFAPSAHFKKANAFLNRAASDGEEIPAIRVGKASIPLGKVGGDGQSGAVQLIGEKVISAGKHLSQGSDSVGQVHSLLADLKILKNEGHEAFIC